MTSTSSADSACIVPAPSEPAGPGRADIGRLITPLTLGDPGHTASELSPGPPVARIGLPDVALTSAVAGGALLHAASVRGLQHRSTATVRQDAFALSRWTAPDLTEWALAVVCDGVGGFGLSDYAAELVSRELLILAGSGLRWVESFVRVNQLLRESDQYNRSVADPDRDPDESGMATTVVALAVRREGDGWAGDVAWVGDSSLWHLDPEEGWCSLAGVAAGEPESDVHSTSVRSLPSADGHCRSHQFQVGPGPLFLLSDGVANPMRWSPLVRAGLTEWWREPPDLFRFGAQVAFGRKSHVDDRTAVGIWPLPGPDQQASGDEDPA